MRREILQSILIAEMSHLANEPPSIPPARFTSEEKKSVSGTGVADARSGSAANIMLLNMMC